MHQCLPWLSSSGPVRIIIDLGCDRGCTLSIPIQFDTMAGICIEVEYTGKRKKVEAILASGIKYHCKLHIPPISHNFEQSTSHWSLAQHFVLASKIVAGWAESVSATV